MERGAALWSAFTADRDRRLAPVAWLPMSVLVLGCIQITACMARPQRQHRNEIRSAYQVIRSKLARDYPDWMKASEEAVFATTLNRAWMLVGEWAAAYVDAPPRASADDL